MGNVKDKKPVKTIKPRGIKIDINTLRRNRIESLKKMIDNEEYVNEAISKLANSLTTGLMK
ncbi:MAG: hypothetical protein AMS17_10195 [Spirochaetes bacterium DG_61]|nr:MAG: hypothetical protein AMS17_10195 [Spirochaetes bacterium DG_61]